MRVKIRHVTLYTYSAPVLLGPHLLRLRPRADGAQQIERCSIHIDPAPSGMGEVLDFDGNATTAAWFSGSADTLRVDVETEAETSRANPFDFIITDSSAAHVPVHWIEPVRTRVAPYLARERIYPEVTQWAETLANRAGGDTMEFLTGTCRQIASVCRMVVRERGDPLPPVATLAGREGSCRDLAMLFIDACRAVGIPARFVSGYELSVSHDEPHYLHAWAEVYLLGAGWRGFDPSQGLAVADGHLVLAAGPSPQDVAPISGSFSGGGVQAEMHAELRIRSM